MTTTTSVSSSTQTSYSENRSGLTVDDVVEVAVQARLDRADTIDAKITDNETKISAYQETQSRLQDLEDSLKVLSDPSDSSNVFEERSATLTSSSDASASSLMSVTVDSGTDTGPHEVEIAQLATAQRLGSAYQSSRTDELGYDGTLTVGADGSDTADIAVTSDMSLEDVRDAVNEASDTTGVTASIITVSSSQYMLVLTAADTNKEISLSGSGIAESLGLLNADGSYGNELQAAQPAIVNVDGVDGIERDSNDIDDIIDGVTLHLTKAEPGTTITVGIDSDTGSIESAIQDFVSAYNAWRNWVIQNQSTNSDGTAADTAYLYGDSTFRSISAQLGGILGNMVDGHSLSELGLTLDSDNKLELDTTTLENFLSSDLSAAQGLLEYSATTSSSDLKLTSHDGASYSGSFTLDIATDADGNITGASVDGDDSLFTVDGNKIEGAAGTIYAGLTFYYSGTDSKSVSVDVSQGLGDQLYQVTDAAANSDTGSLQSLVDNLDTQDTTLQSESDRIREQAEDYRSYLLDYYGRIEANISLANQTADILKTLMDSENSSSS